MGHSLSKLRRFHHHNQTQIPSQSNPISTPSSSSSTFNSDFNGGSTQNISIPSSSNTTTIAAANERSYIVAGDARRPSASPPPPPPVPSAPLSPNYYHHHLPSSSSLTASPPPPFFSLVPPPPYVDHKTAKKIKNDVNIHKDTVRLFLDDNHLDSHLLSFTFDALVDGSGYDSMMDWTRIQVVELKTDFYQNRSNGSVLTKFYELSEMISEIKSSFLLLDFHDSITIFYFAKEGPNCTFLPLYPGIYMAKTFPFQKGLGQRFYQPSGTGIDLGFFELDHLSRPSKKEDIFPLVISAEATSLPSFMATAADLDHHAQITQAVLKQNNEGHFEVNVIKQILWIEGMRYELREIYGMENSSEQGFGDDDSESSGACVICMVEPKDTAVLPCRHMCMCSECAKQLRLQSKRCPVCRQLIQELIEIKIENQTKASSSL